MSALRGDRQIAAHLESAFLASSIPGFMLGGGGGLARQHRLEQLQQTNYQPQGWARACRFLALRYENEPAAGAAEQYQLFATSAYTLVLDAAVPILKA